jgi:SAM-dependent methyltransferase
MRSVNSDLYTTEYFLTENAGWKEFNKSHGAILDERYKRALALADLKPGMKILDLGCGRGELVINCARKGIFATGIDYSASAIELAQKALQMYPEEIREKVRLMQLDSKTVTFPSGSFDCIFLLDFAEHLYPEELSQALSNALYYLKKGGRLIIHTAPNRLFFYGYAYWRLMRTILNVLLGRKERPPRNPRNEYQIAMHVNEMSPFELKKYLRKNGFNRSKIWLHSYGWLGVRWIDAPLSNPRVLLGRIILELFPFSTFYPLKLFFYDSIWCLAKK